LRYPPASNVGDLSPIGRTVAAARPQRAAAR
jgi:hypothetical protein